MLTSIFAIGFGIFVVSYVEGDDRGVGLILAAISIGIGVWGVVKNRG